MNTQTDNAIRLIKHCHRGGNFGMFWQSATKRSHWYEIGKPATMPTAPNTYFGVSPSSCIPTLNSEGEPAAPEYVATQNKYIGAVNCLYAEMDAKHIGGMDAVFAVVENLRVSPSVVVCSGGGVHIYHLFDTPIITDNDATRQHMATIQADWVTVVGGDKGAKDLRRVLRVPGTLNMKYDPPRRVEVVESLSDWTLYEPSFLFDMLRIQLDEIKPSEALGSVGISERTIVPRQHNGAGIIDTFNRDNKPQDVLSRNGYHLNSEGTRFTRPGKDYRAGISGLASESGGHLRVFTFSSNDALFEDAPNGKRHALDAFDVFTKLEHGGNRDAALSSAAQLQGRAYLPKAAHEQRITITV